MAKQPLFLGVATEKWYPSIKSALTGEKISDENWIELAPDAKGKPAGNKGIPADHNGDVWLFGHGMSAPNAASELDRFGIFSSFDDKTKKGLLFDNPSLLEFLAQISTKNLFIFACYQGKYLDSYKSATAGGVAPIKFATGFQTSAMRASAPEFLKSYFKSPATYKMELPAKR